MIPNLVASRLGQACIRPCNRSVLQPILSRYISASSANLHHCEASGKTSVASYVLFRQHSNDVSSVPEEVQTDKTSVTWYVLNTRETMPVEEDIENETDKTSVASYVLNTRQQLVLEESGTESPSSEQVIKDESVATSSSHEGDKITTEMEPAQSEETAAADNEPVKEKDLSLEEIEMGLSEELVSDGTFDLEHEHVDSDSLIDIDDVINGKVSSSADSQEVTSDESAGIDDMLLSSTEMDEDEAEDEDDEDYYACDDDIRSQILSVALENVPMYGWSAQSISVAVDALDLSPTSTEMFKRGGLDLLLFFTEEANKTLTEHLIRKAQMEKLDTEEARGRFIESAIKTRLQMIIPYIDTWPQALKLLASPGAAPDVVQNGTEMMDEIFYHSGDLSTDMTWYSKRAVLASIYCSTELFMLNDKSPEFRDTWAFLHRRMNDARSLKDLKDSLDNAVSDTFKLVTAGFTTAQNILGMGSRRR